MTATVRVYTSADASAPSLNGLAGTLIAVLDGCLVNGYGGNTPAGWTKPYSGTNLAVYLAGAGTPRPYLRVDDTGSSTAIARVVGYEAMTSVNVGTGAFPTDGLLAGGAHLIKSSGGDGTVRPWLLIACERAFYLFISGGSVSYGAHSTTNSGMGFGVFLSNKVGDTYNMFLNAQEVGSVGADKVGTGSTMTSSSSNFVVAPGFWIARRFTQMGTSIQAGKMPVCYGTSATLGLIGSTYPEPIMGGMKLSRLHVTEGDPTVMLDRGYLPGFWVPLHVTPGNMFDTFSGMLDLAGKTFIIPPAYNSSNQARIAIETTGSWDL